MAGNRPHLDWSPDNLWIAYPRRVDSNGSGRWQIYKVEVDSGAETCLTSVDCDHLFPQWAPEMDQNGKWWIVYQRGPVGGSGQIYKIAADGSGEEVQLTHEYPSILTHSRLPQWSPDGRWIAYQKREYGGVGRWQIYKMRATR